MIYMVYALCAIIGSILTLASFMKVQKYAFFGKLNEKWQNIKEVPVLMQLSMVILAVVCIVSSLMIMPNFKPFLDSAADALLSGNGYKDAVIAAVR